MSLLAGAALAWRVGGAKRRRRPARSSRRLPALAAARHRHLAPVDGVEQPKPAAVLPGRPQETDVAPVARVSPAKPTTSRPGAPDALPQIGDAPPRNRAAPPGPCLVVERSAPALVAAGKPLVYEIVVRNVGGAAAQRVRVEEQVPAADAVTTTEPRAEGRGNVLAWELGVLAPGAESRLARDNAAARRGRRDHDGHRHLRHHEHLHGRVARAGLSLTVGEPAPAQVGQKVTFQIQIANNTAAPLSRLLLRARLSAGLQHSQGNLIEAAIPALAAGEVKAVPLEVVAAKAGRSTLTAMLTLAGAEPKTAEAAVEVTDPAAAAPAPAPVPAVVTQSPEVHPTPAPARCCHACRAGPRRSRPTRCRCCRRRNCRCRKGGSSRRERRGNRSPRPAGRG